MFRHFYIHATLTLFKLLVCEVYDERSTVVCTVDFVGKLPLEFVLAQMDYNSDELSMNINALLGVLTGIPQAVDKDASYSHHFGVGNRCLRRYGFLQGCISV